MFKRICLGIAGLALSVPLIGCGSESQGQEEVNNVTQEWLTNEVTASTASVFTSKKSLGMNAAGGFCFLTKISGKFRGGAEGAVVDMDLFGNWFVQVASGQNSPLTATARCVNWGSFSPTAGTVTLDTGWISNTWTTLSSSPYDYCYLAGISGEMNGGGEGAGVSWNNGQYQLWVTRSSGAGMWGKGMCVRINNTTFSPVQGLTVVGPANNGAVSRLVSINQGAYGGLCMIGRYAGYANDVDDYVRAEFWNNRTWNFTAFSGFPHNIMVVPECVYYNYSPQ